MDNREKDVAMQMAEDARQAEWENVSFTAEVFKAAPLLKVVGRAGVGVDNVDVEAATNHGVVVMNTPGGNTISTAEHAFTLMMSLARHIPQGHQSVVEGRFKEGRKAYAGVELYNKTLAILGMGRIGAEFATRAMGFGPVTAHKATSVVGHSP